MCVYHFQTSIPNREQGGGEYGEIISIPNYRINSFDNHKLSLVVYNLHTMG